MRGLQQSIFVLGFAALSAVPALAQPQPEGPGLPPGAAVPVADPGLDLVIAAGLVADKSLQEDLKLTADQVKDIAAAVRKIRQKYQPKLSTLDPKERSELLAKFDDETRKAAAKVLKPEQAKRLKQIERQIVAGGVYAFLGEEVAKELKLTDDQKGKIKGILTELQKEITKQAKKVLGEKIQSGGLDDLKKIVAHQKAAEKLTKAAMADIYEVLTADQRKAWKELIGEPFEPTSR